MPSSVINCVMEDLKNDTGEGAIESERVLCLRKALKLTGLSSDYEIDESGGLVPAEHLHPEGTEEECEDAPPVSYKERQKVKSSLMRRLASAGFSADAVISAVKAVEKLIF